MSVTASDRPDLLGVLGGMGSLATADFLRKVVALTPAERDEDHLPIVVSCVPQIPPRRLEGPSPLSAMRRQRDLLLQSGARYLAMPCNAAHLWHEGLAEDCPVPFLHIADAAVQALSAAGVRGGRLGILGRPALIESGLYQGRLQALGPQSPAGLGYEVLEPTGAELDELVVPGIVAVKQNRIEEAEALVRAAVEALCERGAQRVILACTELPVAMAGSPIAGRTLDVTEALARACVEWAMRARADSEEGSRS